LAPPRTKEHLGWRKPLKRAREQSWIAPMKKILKKLFGNLFYDDESTLS
jgi:hypothetical protein